MVVIRPATLNDLDAVFALAEQATFGLTLVKDRDYLRDRIEMAERAFMHQARRPGGEKYFFVMQELDTGQVIGTFGIASKKGGFEPTGATVLKRSFTNPNSLASARKSACCTSTPNTTARVRSGKALHLPSQAAGGHGRLLSLSRFLSAIPVSQARLTERVARMQGGSTMPASSPSGGRGPQFL